MKYRVPSTMISVILLITLLLAIGCTDTQRVTPQSPGTEQPSATSPSPGKTPGQQPTLKTGTIEVHITDAPPEKDKEVKSIEITVSSVSVHMVQANQEQAASDNSTGKQKQEKQQGGDEWLALTIVKNKTFNLLALKGVDDVLATGQLTEGKYTQIRLIVESAKAIFADNSTSEATVPSGELKFVQPFDVVPNKVTTLLLDFDADRSFTVTGSGQVMVKPVVKLSVKPAK